MRGLGDLIVRLVAIVFGLGLAFVGAGLFLGIGFYNDVMAPVLEPEMEPTVSGTVALVVGLFWSPIVAAAAFLPALVLVFIAESLRLRSLTANVMLGGLAALLSFWFRVDFSAQASISDGTLVVLLATGFIGGFFYWLVAGRNAGKWLESPA